MKIEIEIDEKTAAAVWANRTNRGVRPAPMAQLVKDVVEDDAAEWCNAFPGELEGVLKLFRDSQK